MLTSARKTMPPLDYVSIIRSVYADGKTMLAGSLASAFAAMLTAYHAQSLPLVGISVLFIVLGLARFFNMQAFWNAAVGNEDAASAERWENRAVVLGALLALLHGSWCFVAMLIVREPYAELVSVSLTMAVMVGICARNFGLDRLVTIQMLMVILPLSLGLLLRFDVYHPLLAILLFVMLSGFRKLAAGIRDILLSAVHGRVEASRLAAELDIAITTLEHGLLMLDENGNVTLSNAKAKALLSRMDIAFAEGQTFNSILDFIGTSGVAPARSIERLSEIVSRRQSGKVTVPLSSGQYFEVTVSSRRSRSVLLLEDITERVTADERISFMARHDTLTGLPNRSHFNALAQEELSRRGARKLASALMVIDIDEFKHVNDSFGHVIGDELLRQVSDRLRHSLPAGTILARQGGDEFVALAPYDLDNPDRQEDVEHTLAAFETPFNLKGINLPVRVSIGLVVTTESDDELDELMTKADLALYGAKADGKARAQIFHAQMDIDYHYRQRLKADLRQAVADGALTLAFQPQLDIETRKIVSCEALARWTHPELGPVSPATFIPMAEEMGLISDITAFVVESATRECAQWAGPVGVAVNVSARDFRGLDLLTVVSRSLDRAGLPANRLEIEVTETAVIEERDLANSVLQGLADRGIVIALDDFGTGYSSLSYLNALPFNKLKIDRSFVADIGKDPRALLLLSNVARLGRDLDLTVVAEGVETEEQLELMQGMTRVQQVQGYFFSRPLPSRDIAELIARMNGGVESAQKAKRHRVVNGR
ncbi:putative bifunctional diguanylate cyclase/phosphodiesterase [Devosia rhizoryzae]|uniref:EAL domain-containing protein n=1 Tax=Devosia rhizoryzae TaxID=2774137 RepID=A0ABX7C4L2_9HYPH|nr:EAL domain-containing protein [Devosia rhizoryzae]QQR39165.1 EAL domain-containing protein [Devosia rhizoryzae]